MIRGARRYLRELLAIFGFVAIAAVVGAYIVDKQRLRWPWEDFITIEASFATAQAVTPGQGQTVTVAGVRVGEVSGVRVEDGRAVVEMELDNDELGPVYRNATMLLRPKTGLNDMTIQLDPGTPDPALPERGRLADGDRLPAGATLPNVHPDQVLAALDSDTRRYLSIVANTGGQALDDQGELLRRVLKASQPTLERGARVTQAVAARRKELRRLVSNLRRLSRATASKDRQLASLVEASSRVLGAIGRREDELAAAVERLPGALEATGDALRETRALAREAAPALEELLPVARELEPALRGVRPLLRDATPVLRDDLRPLVREAAPLVRKLRPSVEDIDASAPPLVRTGEVLNYVANELGHNPEGREEGYLFYAAWFFHNASTVLSVEDSHGVAWRGLVMFGCSTVSEVLASSPAFEPIATADVCPEATEQVR